MRISKRSVDELVAGEKDTFWWDDALKGFGVKVTPLGKKVFVLQYRVGKSGTPRRITIGEYGQPWSPDRARDEAMRLRGIVASGVDPADRPPDKVSLTVKQLWEKYLEQGSAHKKPTTLARDRSSAIRHVIPLIGEKDVRTLTKPDIQSFFSSVKAGKTATDEKTGPRGRAIVKGGPGTANRTLDLLSSMMTFAIELGIRQDNPTKGIKKFSLRTRDRYLNSEELKRLGEALAAEQASGTNPVALAAIRFLSLSGCRKSEALGLKWSWIDLENSLVSLPDSKTGARQLHLGSAAKDLLMNMPRFANSPWVFPSVRGEGPVVGIRKIWDAVRIRAGLGDFRLHDLRHSFASSAVSAGQSLYVVGKLLGHSQARTTQRYAHLAKGPVQSAADAISDEIAKKLAAK
ncbi:tyrosine-type recombinase/integrase [Mesorhizobium sp. WSM4976]|uniref:tyrosine-type recombinase/integrase n=1 Tax=Mesorhizobium sp. WSM4976 TaxID=3038549 RepID=UPI002417D2B4|nr:site-specific integrase [Mesorhizobium sp. WSM4976]MDG4898183.1 tyrosine-type recombinase/integrase [Mesorhizobium sp. WSM4976]